MTSNEFVSRGPPIMHAQLDALKFAIWNASLACGSGAAACLLISAKSFAADLPVKMPLPYEYDWTGFYVGGHIGLALGNSNFTAKRPARHQCPARLKCISRPFSDHPRGSRK
jgi:hypothetical protein